MRRETSEPGSPPIGRLPKLVRFVLTVLIATALGPLIGSVALVIATRLLHFGFSAGLNDLLEQAAVTVIFGYSMGWKIAFVAGTIIAVAALWRPPTFLTVIAATVVAGVACQVGTAGRNPPLVYPQSCSVDLCGYRLLAAFSATAEWPMIGLFVGLPFTGQKFACQNAG